MYIHPQSRCWSGVKCQVGPPAAPREDTRCRADREGKEGQCGPCRPPPPRWEVPAVMGSFISPTSRPCWEREREEAAWRGQGVCEGRGHGSRRRARPGTKREEGTRGWAGPGCGKRRELGAPGGGWGGWLRELEAKERLQGSPALENQLSRPARLLLRVRWEGYGGSQGQENLLGWGCPWQF